MKYGLFLLLMFLGAYLLPLGLRPMITPDEFRYAEIPREMIESGNCVVPRLAGMDYFEKPVMGYWLTAASFKVFGYNRFALRLPAALAAGLTALLLTIFLRRCTGETRLAVFGGILYLDFGLVYGLGNVAVLDSQLTLFIVGTLTAFFPAYIMEKWNTPRVILLLAAGIFAGFGFLTKGFIALAFPGMVISVFLLWEKRWKAFLTLPWLPLAGCLAVTLPWIMAVHRQAPDFWRYFIQVEHLDRFLRSTMVGQHAEGWWFYLAVLIPLLMPGGLLLILSGRGLRHIGIAELLQKSHVRYLVTWFLVPFCFFSVCRGKLATYILPCFLPLAAMGAMGIAEYFRQGGSYRMFRRMMTLLGALLVTGGVAGTAVAFLPGRMPVSGLTAEIIGLMRGFVPAAVAAAVWGGVLLYQRKKSWNRNLFAFFAGQIPLLFLVFLAMPEEIFGDKSPEAALKRLEKFIPPRAQIFAHRVNMHGAVWVWHRVHDITLIWAEGEWDYAVHSTVSGKGRYLSPKELLKYLASPGRKACAVLMSTDRFMKNHNRFPEDGVLHHDHQLTLVVYPSKSSPGSRKAPQFQSNMQ